MKGDLISRSALTERIVDLLVFEWGYEGIEESVRQIFSEIPAVDAVEVVQCIDCRYLKTCNRTIELIPRQEQIGYLRCVVHSCEYGERRGDDATD